MTWEELIKLPQDIAVIHTSTQITGMIHKEYDNLYFLSDDKSFDGSKPMEMKGFKYSWWICDIDEYKNRDSREVYRHLEVVQTEGKRRL